MANLIKTSNGLLFYDDFSTNTLIWTLSPSDKDCLTFGDDGLKIQHNDSYISYTMVEPEVDEYSCIVKLDHTPLDEKDIAGILIISNTQDYAECQSYLATASSAIGNGGQNISIDSLGEVFVEYTIDDGSGSSGLGSGGTTTGTSGSSPDVSFVDTIYKYLKFNKVNNTYAFYASPDGFNWITVGNVKYQHCGGIGLFLYATDNPDVIDKSHCIFNYFCLYNSKFLSFSNIDLAYEFEIIDGNGNIIIRSDVSTDIPIISRSKKLCLINTNTLPMPILNPRIRIFEKDNYINTISEHELGENIFGGDSFSLTHDIRVFIDNVEVDQMNLYDLGKFKGEQFIKLDIYNHEDYVLSNLTVKVIRYSEYYGGEEQVMIAKYDEAESAELVYSKQVTIDQLNPTEGKSVFVKLVDKPIQDFYMTANAFRFKIIIE